MVDINQNASGAMTGATGSSTTPPPGTGFQPAAPLAAAGASFTSAASDDASMGGTDAPGGSAKASTSEQIRSGAQKLVEQAGDHARKFAEDGKSRAGDALDELSRMIHDAAEQVDAKLGDQYGQYARQAADQVSRLSDGIKAKQVDDLVEDARVLVGKSPAIAIGVAAALGFVVARAIRAGVDAAPGTDGGTSA